MMLLLLASGACTQASLSALNISFVLFDTIRYWYGQAQSNWKEGCSLIVHSLYLR